MTQAMTLSGESPRAMHAAQEAAVLRATLRDGNAPPAVRRRLAVLLNQLDAFDATIDLLGHLPAATLDFEERLMLAGAWLAKGAPDDLAAALACAEAARAGALTDAQAAAALLVRAKALVRLGRTDEGRAALRDALELDADNADAFARLATHLLLADDPAGVVALADALAARGAGHSGLFAMRATALARLGRHEAARHTLGLGDFLYTTEITPATRWSDLAAFNAALADELTTHSGLRFERNGTASVQSWRIDSLAAGGLPLARLLVDRIVAAVQRHADAIAGIDHPWVAAMPRRAVLRSWCVITERSGYEEWHMHPSGWMSGVYYVAVPDAVAAGASEDGCLMLGLSDRLAGGAAAARVGHRLLRPRPGLLGLFPSHSYHRTFPHGAPGKRICVAFDVRPE